MADIIGAHRIAVKIYRLSGTTWVEFSPQPIVPGLAEGIWGGPDNTIWTHNSLTGASQRYLFFNGTSWSQSVGPSTSNTPTTIHGSADGVHVYSACTFEIHKLISGTWTLIENSWRARNIWCDVTGQHVWTTGGYAIGIQEHVYYSDDYGASWTDMWSGALSDLGLSGASNPTANGVFGRSPTEIYVNWGWGSGAVPPAVNGNAGGIAKYDGVSWSWVSQTAGLPYLMQQDGGVWADGSGLYVCNGGFANENIHIDNGGSLLTKVTPTNHAPPLGRNIIGIEGESVVVVLDGKLVSVPSEQYASFDGGSTWQQTTDPWGTSRYGLGSLTTYGWVIQNEPYLQNQSPAPDSTSNPFDTPVSTDVVDDNGDLDLSSVQIWINETLAWTGTRAMPGFTVVAGNVSDPDGGNFAIELAEPFEPGLQTVRVKALDAAANALDDSWSFTTVAQVVEDADVEAEEAAVAGIDLKLDTAHDLVVTDYDLELVAGADEVAQHLLVGLRLFWGEWYLDDEAGVPYYRDVLINAPKSRVIDALFRQEILADADIEALTEFTLAIDRATRHLDVAFRAVSSVGVVDVEAVIA